MPIATHPDFPVKIGAATLSIADAVALRAAIMAEPFHQDRIFEERALWNLIQRADKQSKSLTLGPPTPDPNADAAVARIEALIASWTDRIAA